MSDLRDTCDKAMKQLLDEGTITEKEFYDRLRSEDLTPRQMIELWEATRDDYIRVGLIERAVFGGYKKVAPPNNLSTAE